MVFDKKRSIPLKLCWLQLLTILIVLVSCNRESKPGAAAFLSVFGDTITVAAHSELAGKLKTTAIENGTCAHQVTTAGVIRAIPTRFAEIASPFKGRITKSFLHLGMKTVPGTPLFEIRSADFMEAQKHFMQAKSQMDLAGKNLSRQQDLVRNGVGTQKDLEEAQATHSVAKNEYENAQAAMKIFNSNGQSPALGRPLIVRAPIAGEIVENKVVLGQYLKEDALSVAIVADLSQVWIVGQVKEKDIRFVETNDPCTIEVVAFPGDRIQAKVAHIEGLLNEETHTANVLTVAENSKRRLKPGMYATIYFTGKPMSCIEVPAKALFQMKDDAFVFLVAGPGKYIRRKVQTDGTNGDKVVVTSGLKAGDAIITEGGIYLLQAN